MAQDQIQLWEAAAAAFDVRHRLVRAEHHALPTPSREFNVAALIAHVIGNQVQFGRMLGGEAADDASWPDARAAMAEALTRPDSLVGSVDHPALGDSSRVRLLAIATNDMLIHAWDLAKALGVDTQLPAQSLQPAIDGIAAFPPAVRNRLFGRAIKLPSAASLQDRMLGAAGRRP